MDDYKLAFIYGTNEEECDIWDGKIEKFGDSSDEDSFHSTCLLDHAKERYPDVQIFKKMGFRHKPETIGYFYTLFGHILFLNTTKNVQKYGKSGLFMLPSNVTEKQKESLFKFCEEIEDFSVHILYDLNIEDGILEGKELSSVENKNISSLFISYFERENKSAKSL